MNIKISVAIFILLSFFNMGAISNNITTTKSSFDTIEKNIKSVSEFEENGVKLQYKTKDSIKEETYRIKKYLIKNISHNYKEIGKDQFEISNEDFYINVKLWCEAKYTYVEFMIINKNYIYTTKDLKDILQKLENVKLENVKYFFYYEGRVNTQNNSIDKLINKNYIQNIRLLDINNGYTGTGYLYNGDKFNFALINYDTGSHIIIGTPIIFATY